MDHVPAADIQTLLETLYAKPLCVYRVNPFLNHFDRSNFSRASWIRIGRTSYAMGHIFDNIMMPKSLEKYGHFAENYRIDFS